MRKLSRNFVCVFAFKMKDAWSCVNAGKYIPTKKNVEDVEEKNNVLVRIMITTITKGPRNT